MKKLILAVLVLLIAPWIAHASWSVAISGTWPSSWPKEFEPLRKQSRSYSNNFTRYHIPFTKREEFEAVWPSILKIKSEGAPIILVRGSYKDLGDVIDAGVCIQCPLQEPRGEPKPLPGVNPERVRWMQYTFIELVVDGNVVDLNRISLPADTPIIDQRFQEKK